MGGVWKDFPQAFPQPGLGEFPWCQPGQDGDPLAHSILARMEKSMILAAA